MLGLKLISASDTGSCNDKHVRHHLRLIQPLPIIVIPTWEIEF